MSGLNVSATQKGDEGGQTSKQVEQKARDQIGVQTSDPMILAVSMEERESAEEKRNWSEKYLKEEQQGKLGQDSRNWLQSVATWPLGSKMALKILILGSFFKYKVKSYTTTG